MDLLPNHLRALLPPLGSQQHLVDPIVYIRLLIPDSDHAWYVTEGSAEGDDFRFFGFVIQGPERAGWCYFRLSELTWMPGPGGPLVVRDETFRTGRLIDVLFAPWLRDEDPGAER